MIISDKYLVSNKEDLEAIEEVLNNKKLSGTSDVIEKYEKELASFFKSKYAVTVSSGTAAVQTALFSVGVESGDEVIVSSNCPCMTVFPIIFIGAKPIFCDVNRDNFGLNLDSLNKKITPKTKAIIEIPMWGYPTEVNKLYKFSKSEKIPLILDLAQAQGTKLKDNYLSFYGDISCFSTHDRKLIATGEGGYILTNNKYFYNLAKKFIKFGDMNGVNFGLNYKLGAMQAAIGIKRINNFNNQLKKRKENARYIMHNLNNPKIKEFEIVKNGSPNYYSLLLVLNFKNNSKIIEELENKGIPSDIKRYNYKVLYKYPIFKKFKSMCKNSEDMSLKITTIPVHPAMQKTELDYIINSLNSLK